VLLSVLLLIASAIALAPVAGAVGPVPLLAAAGALVLIGIAYTHPPAAAYILLVATPLTAGMARDALIPYLRPHEALGVILGIGVALRALGQLLTAHRLPLRLGRIDLAILLMAGTSSILPLLWMVARGVSPTVEDLFYAAAIWKFYGLFVLIRASVRTADQVRRCLVLILSACGVLAVIAILQALQVANVPALVNRVYPIENGIAVAPGRGSATLGSSIAVGDVMAFCVAACLGWALRTTRHRLFLLALSILFAFGAIASGQFSGVIALIVSVFTVAVVTGQVRRLLLVFVPTALVGAVVLRPVLQARLAALDISTGLPQSWWVRLENLRLYVWPDVFSGLNWLFGVRPSAVLRVAAPWGSTIYIESGHTWLLWTGGIPFFAAYLYFTWCAVRTTGSLARRRRDIVGVVAIASVASLLVSFVLMSFDPHLTMRGTADLLFSLLALATVPISEHTRARRLRTRTSRSSTPTPDPGADRGRAAPPGPARWRPDGRVRPG
jgi:hypothetical protein